MLEYERLFHRDTGLGADEVWKRLPPPEGDRGGVEQYVYDDEGEIELAVNVALATGRSLLVRGEPGSGKSSLARSVAAKCSWNYCEKTITSKSEARDLLWRFDAIRRLNDAQAGQLVPEDLQRSELTRKERLARTICPYIEPGPLWWAFDRESAELRGASPEYGALIQKPGYPGEDRRADQTVVLVDEIDKADPDLPNDLLVTLGSLAFYVDDLDIEPRLQGKRPPLVVITTNKERSLPQAFLRRCVVLDLPPAEGKRLKSIACAHYPQLTDTMFENLNAQYEGLRKAALAEKRRPPGIAEFLDAVRSCLQLHVTDEHDAAWVKVLRATMWKDEVEMPAMAGGQGG